MQRANITQTAAYVDLGCGVPRLTGIISIRASHKGCDDFSSGARVLLSIFSPRAPCGARPELEYADTLAHLFQSTRPVRGATIIKRLVIIVRPISIHAPRAGRDLRARVCAKAWS